MILDAIGEAQLEVRRENLAFGASARLAIDYHRRILGAIVAGDPPAAREAMGTHLESVERFWQNQRCRGRPSAPLPATSARRRAVRAGRRQLHRTTVVYDRLPPRILV